MTQSDKKEEKNKETQKAVKVNSHNTASHCLKYS